MRLARRDSRFAWYASASGPANDTPPSVGARSVAPSGASSAASAASRPRGQGAKKRCTVTGALEGLRDDEPDDGHEDRQRGDLVEPAIEHVTVTVALRGEVRDELAEVDVEHGEDRDEGHLGVQPAARHAEAQPHPQAERDRE